MSTSMPVQEEWERDDEELFAEEEDYIPSELLNSQIRHRDDRDASNANGNMVTISDTEPRDFARRDSFRSTGNGFGSPEFGTKWGSPSMASPGNRRFMGLFAEQKRKEKPALTDPRLLALLDLLVEAQCSGRVRTSQIRHQFPRLFPALL